MTTSKAIRIIETSSAKNWLREDGIIQSIDYSEHSTPEQAWENLSAMEELSSGRKKPVLVDITRVRSIDIKARKLYASEKAAKVLSAVALLINSPLNRVIANFFLGINKPPYPIKIFTSEKDATTWLTSFIEK